MSHAIRHQSTDAEIEDLIKLINCHLPTPVNPTKYMFFKKFANITKVQNHYYCPTCIIPLHFGNAKRINCPNCESLYIETDLQRSGSLFVYISLKEQLRYLLSGPLFYKLQRNGNYGGISDVTSGQVYKALLEKEIVNNFDISVQCNLDGVSTFKSSKMSMCPIQIAVNELPYRDRKDNIILTGLWCGKEKPVMDIYLRPFIDELKDLHENGINCLPANFDEPVNIKVHTFLSSVDSVARCILQNINQFNGQYGCSLCLHPGEHVKVGNGYARVYCGDKRRARTEHQHKIHATMALAEGRPVYGVKGPSLFMLVPIFNIITSFPPDYMHSVLLGVVKMFFIAWFDSKNSECPWYIGSKKRDFNHRLLNILPPCEITRVPRSLDDLKLYKASEWKNLLLYYSLPCLHKLVAERYYKHWSLLVYSMHNLLSSKISEYDLNEAERALQKFVFDTERLYGPEYMKFNVHLLLHIPKAVKFFGALWAWSAFPFESYNRILRDMIYNSQSVLHQVCKSYLRLQSIKYNNVFQKQNCSAVGKQLFDNYLGKFRTTRSCLLYGDNLRIFGRGKSIKLNIVQKLTVHAVLRENVVENATSYERFIYKHILYHCCNYKRMYKRNNSIIKTIHGTFLSIMNILCVVNVSGEKKYVIIGKAFDFCGDETLCTTNNINSSKYSYIVQESNNTVACLLDQIDKKCIIIPYRDDKHCIIPLVNVFETD